MKDRLISGGLTVKRLDTGGGAPLLNGSFTETACVLQCIYTSMKQRDKALLCQHVKCISILDAGVGILQNSYHRLDTRVLEDLK